MTDPMPQPRFDFGENWSAFSRSAIDASRIAQAERDFAELCAGVDLAHASFLDIGFGQGLALLCAAKHGARVVGCDINSTCLQALAATAKWFPCVDAARVPVLVGSILDAGLVDRLRVASPDGDGAYTVVHSWGVLHHTGQMQVALENAACLVRGGGHLLIAIYNRHWSSPIWRTIKKAYCRSSRTLQRLMVGGFVPVIWLAKLLVTQRNPLSQARGMSFYYDVVDWVGGYPYEYASVADMIERADSLGFECIRVSPATVPTGCNQFVFRRREK
jgi:SAM-dependent methyltransferase